jgi:hypothetical protein
VSQSIEQLIKILESAHPGITVERARATDPGSDDDRLWSVRHPQAFADVQIESVAGEPPFLIASDLAPPTLAPSVEDAAHLIVARLGLSLQAGS